MTSPIETIDISFRIYIINLLRVLDHYHDAIIDLESNGLNADHIYDIHDDIRSHRWQIMDNANQIPSQFPIKQILHSSLEEYFQHRHNMRQVILPQLISVALHPSRIAKQLEMFDDIEDFFNNI